MVVVDTNQSSSEAGSQALFFATLLLKWAIPIYYCDRVSVGDFMLRDSILTRMFKL